MKLKEGMREKGNGSIEYRFRYEGKRYSVSGKSVRDCIQKQQEKMAELMSGSYIKNSSVTLNQYYDEYVEREAARIKAGTLRRYKCIYRNHMSGTPTASKKIRDIERRELINIVQHLNESSSANANGLIVFLKGLFDEAVKDSIIVRSPMKEIKKFKEVSLAKETTHRALTKEETAFFLEEAKREWFYEASALMLCTGIRVGELAALHWSDVDFINSVIHIKRTVADSENGRIENDAKTDAGKREIPITNSVSKILHSQKLKMRDFGISDIENHIFLSSRGNLLRNTVFEHMIPRVLKRLSEKGVKIEPFTSHAFRDTYATRFIESGGNMNTLKTLLGHSSITITMDLYAHVLPDTKMEEAEKIVINL